MKIPVKTPGHDDHRSIKHLNSNVTKNLMRSIANHKQPNQFSATFLLDLANNLLPGGAFVLSSIPEYNFTAEL